MTPRPIDFGTLFISTSLTLENTLCRLCRRNECLDYHLAILSYQHYLFHIPCPMRVQVSSLLATENNNNYSALHHTVSRTVVLTEIIPVRDLLKKPL